MFNTTPNQLNAGQQTLVPSGFLMPVNSIVNTLPQATTSNGLPNDNCMRTFDCEKRLLEKFTPAPYRYHHDELSTVIYSRTHNTHYLWPKDKPLTTQNLEDLSSTGHTLGIDNTKSYFRMFNFDLDCLCRKFPNVSIHLSMRTVTEVCDFIMQELKVLFGGNQKIVTSIWQNKCGFHIYTNIGVSLPTHLYLWNIMQARFKQETFIIEVPSIMPLPYSAKITGSCYTPVHEGNQPLELTTTNESTFIEMFEFTPVYQEGFSTIEITTIGSQLYMTKRRLAIPSHCTPRFFNVVGVKIIPQFEYMEQMHLYINAMTTQYANDMDVVGRVDLSKINTEDKYRIVLFLNLIKSKFTQKAQNATYAMETLYNDSKCNTIGPIDGIEIPQDQSDACNLFIYLSTVRYGCLYLEPFAVALCLHMNMNTTQSFERFRELLRILYSNVMTLTQTVGVFIDRVNLKTIFSYNRSCLEILDCLAFYINYNLDPTDNIVDQVDALMSQQLCCTSASMQNDLKTKYKGPEFQKQVAKILEVFYNVIKQLHLVYHDKQSLQYFVINTNGGRSYSSCTSFNTPAIDVLNRWLVTTSINKSFNLGKNTQELNCVKMTHPDPKFSDGQCMIATKLGTFNHITGLYSANTWLLCFKKYRDVAVYPYLEMPTLKSSFTLNDSVVNYTNRTIALMKTFSRTITEFYMHAMVVPALLQLRYIASIDNYNLCEFFKHLTAHETFESAYFLIEYYPINPRFIYLLLSLFDNLETILSYEKLCLQVFHYRTPTIDAWRKKFQRIFNDCIYDDTLPTHLDKLCSLRDTGIDTTLEMTPDTAFLLTIVVIIMLKCPSYKILLEAFNIEMPKIEDLKANYEHPQYPKDMSHETNATTMLQNVERAKRIVYGPLDSFETDLLNEYITLCISTSFNPDRVSDLLDTIGLTFLTSNVLKKMILYHGRSNVGKTVLCDKIQQLTGPCIGRFRTLTDALKRSETTGSNLLTILNETSSIDPMELKSITGNDAVSAPKYYTQCYEMQQSQSLVYGATNSLIKFCFSSSSSTKITNVDITSVERLYSITLTGESVDGNYGECSLFAMLITSKFFRNIVNMDTSDAPKAMGWLAFATYLMKRNKDGIPYLNVNSEESKAYKHMVYYTNNRLYRCLVNAGISHERDFYMSSAKLLNIVKPSFDRGSSDNVIKSKGEFIALFLEHHDTDLNKCPSVLNFQESGFIQHVRNHLKVMPVHGSVITNENLTARVESYSSTEHKDNARRWFLAQHEKYYNYKAQQYENIAFTNDPIEFAGNECSYDAPINHESLVVKSV